MELGAAPRLVEWTAGPLAGTDLRPWAGGSHDGTLTHLAGRIVRHWGPFVLLKSLCFFVGVTTQDGTGRFLGDLNPVWQVAL